MDGRLPLDRKRISSTCSQHFVRLSFMFCVYLRPYPLFFLKKNNNNFLPSRPTKMLLLICVPASGRETGEKCTSLGRNVFLLSLMRRSGPHTGAFDKRGRGRTDGAAGGAAGGAASFPFHLNGRSIRWQFLTARVSLR